MSNRKTRKKREKVTIYSDLNRLFQWFYYSAHHPNWDMDRVLRDFHNKVKLTDIEKGK